MVVYLEMRWKLEKPLTESDYGKTRTIYKFLWLPREINYEVRWFEGALIEQVVTFDIVIDPDCISMSYRKYYWQDSKWIDPPTNLR